MDEAAERRRRAVFTNYAERPPADPACPGLWGYTDAISYAPGSAVRVHVNTTAPAYDAILHRDGGALQEVWRGTGLPGRFHPTPADCSVVGCGWPVAFEIPLRADWPSGAYRLALRAGDLAWDHVFILRPAPDAKPGRVLFVASTATWTAYNDWGGSNHYEGLTGPSGDQ